MSDIIFSLFYCHFWHFLTQCTWQSYLQSSRSFLVRGEVGSQNEMDYHRQVYRYCLQMVCLSVVSISVRMFVCFSVCWSVYPSVYMFVCLFFLCIYVCLSVYLSVYLSACLYIRVSVCHCGWYWPCIWGGPGPVFLQHVEPVSLPYHTVLGRHEDRQLCELFHQIMCIDDPS